MLDPQIQFNYGGMFVFQIQPTNNIRQYLKPKFAGIAPN